MQRLEVSGAVRSIYGSLGVKRLIHVTITLLFFSTEGPSSENTDTFHG